MPDFSETSGAQAALPDILLSEVEGEPRARDLDVAERLGFGLDYDIRKLIRRHQSELLRFGVLATVAKTSGVKGGRPGVEFWLNEEQALLIAAVSDAPNAPAVRAELIRVFVAWRRGHLTPPAFDGTLTDFSPAMRSVIGGIVKGIVHKEVEGAVTTICTSVIAAIMPDMLKAALASQTMLARRGRTAGQLLCESGFPPVKGLASWFGHRMEKLGYCADGEGRADHGDRAVRIFDPDKVRVWLREGGRETVERKIAARRGQKVIHLVPPVSEAARVF